MPQAFTLKEVPVSVAVSVVIPTLNEEGRIGALLEALEAQTGAPEFEILVCDGKSNDRTVAISNRYKSVRVLLGERGVSRQRNLGARHASGELLVFLDADDLPSPHFLKQVWESYCRLPFAIACPWLVAGDGSRFSQFCYFAFNLGFFAGQSTLRMGSGVCLICPRDRFHKVGGFEEKFHLGEDVHLIRKLCPRYGLHRHLLVPLTTSARRFEHENPWKLMAFYTKITPYLIFGLWEPLQKFGYKAAPYEE
ncbi:glycosyltransferase [bacterium]|nr:MAG: glycosyltransferase [bacterium]